MFALQTATYSQAMQRQILPHVYMMGTHITGM